MKPELIIAKIDGYINSLSKEDRESYDAVLDIITKHPQEKVSSFNQALNNPILNLLEIVIDCKQELKENTIKQTAGNSTLKRIKAVSKYLSSNQDKYQKAWLQNDKLAFTNGFTGFMLNEKLDVSIVDEVVFDLERVFPTIDLSEVAIDIIDVKTSLKLHKAKQKGMKAKDKTACYYEVSEHWYNAQYIIDCFEILGGNIRMYQTSSTVAPAVLESENGKAILLPVRLATVEKARA